MRSITFVVPRSFQVTDAEFELVQSLCRLGEKVKCIKFLKHQYNLSLFDAKHLVDTIGLTQ